MLVLSRREDQSIIAGPVTVTVVTIRGKSVRVLIEAPKTMAIASQRGGDSEPTGTASGGEGSGSLVRTYRKDQKFVIGDTITFRVNRIHGLRVTFGVTAPQKIKIRRGELEPLA